MTAPPPARRRTAALVPVAVAAALLGFGVRLTVLLGAGGLLGSGAYDDGVYYAAAAAFVHGRWPYADVLLLQPPGIVVAGAPFAALGAVAGDPAGVIAARLVWIAAGAASCALVVLLAGRRSWPAGLVAGAFAACFFPLAYGERSLLLETPATLLLLLALLLDRRGTPRAALAAGVLAGLTVDLKIWYVVPVLVLAATSGHRLRLLLGAAGAAAVVAAPFLLRAPEAMVRQVLLDQLGRPRLAGDSAIDRLVVLTGGRYSGGPEDLAQPASVVVGAVAAALLAAACVAAWRSPVGRRAVVLLAATTAVLLASPSFFVHYTTFTAPWAAIALGLGAGALADRIRRPGLRVVVAALLAVLVAAPTVPKDLTPTAPEPDLGALAAAAQRVDGCVRSDDPGLLAALDVLSRDLARGCALRADVTGLTFDVPGYPVVAADRPSSPAWQRSVTAYLLGGDAVVVARDGTGLSRASRQRIAALPVLARSGRLVLHAVPR